MSVTHFGMTSLEVLEAESVKILRAVAAEFERPVLLYSAGKDSSVILHLCRKAFLPGRIPFPLLHVDTGYKFPSMLEFRDRVARSMDLDLLVFRNEAAIAGGTSPETHGTRRCCGLLKTEALLAALREHGFDAAIGGARRDEERSRAKERVFSFRSRDGTWDPRRQRPEIWDLYNGRIERGEGMRVFPLSDWTELDVWAYIALEGIEVHPLYFARRRTMAHRGGAWLPVPEGTAGAETVDCRYRTLGCAPCTGAVLSTASTPEEVFGELATERVSERATRVIDHDADGSMERKKREGYF